MALIQVDYFSKALLRQVHFQAILPFDKVYFDDVVREQKPFKTLYLLHGVFGDETDWVNGTRIVRWAQDRNLAVIMPAGENKFYVDHDKSTDQFSQYIEELVVQTRKIFPLSENREDTYIAGLSMGGYGAIVNGLKYNALFSRIAGLSAALHIETFVNASEEALLPIMRRSYLESVFGDLDKLLGSNKDFHFLAKKLVGKEADLPKVYLACGTEDDLYKWDHAFYEELQELGYEVTWKEIPGGHDWDFWDRMILDELNWLPLDDQEEALSSGHIQEDAQ